jgi:hypothetical protein
MNAFFADTFCWIAFTNVQDLAHERVKAFTRSARPDVICTTEEVLTEYLNYFAAGVRISATRPPSISRTCWTTGRFESWRKQRIPFGPASSFTARV